QPPANLPLPVADRPHPGAPRREVTSIATRSSRLAAWRDRPRRGDHQLPREDDRAAGEEGIEGGAGGRLAHPVLDQHRRRARHPGADQVQQVHQQPGPTTPHLSTLSPQSGSRMLPPSSSATVTATQASPTNAAAAATTRKALATPPGLFRLSAASSSSTPEAR